MKALLERWRSSKKLRLVAQTALALLAAVVILSAVPADPRPASVKTPEPAAAGVEASEAPAVAGAADPSFFETALRWASATILTICALLVAAAFMKRGRLTGRALPLLAVRHRITLGRGASIALVEAGRSYLLVGVGADGVTRLKEFQGEEADGLRTALAAGARGAFAAVLAGLASRQEGRP